jgi:hypothetical protein
MALRALGVLLMAASVASAAAAPEAAPEQKGLIPFVLPWNDSTPGPTDVSGWLPKPAGRFGHVRVSEDGHLQAGDARIRFFGVDLSGRMCAPKKEDADALAARMAKFGINCVRYMGSPFFFGGRRGPEAGNANPGAPASAKANAPSLSPEEAFDRFDWFFAKLKEHGIYADFDLLVARPFRGAGGLPAGIDQAAVRKGRFFYAPLIESQKESARQFLTHRNPYTATTYAEEPSVAIVEIANEGGLIHMWLHGDLDVMPEVLTSDFQRQWDAWLLRRYKDTAALSRAWAAGEEPLGQEMLRNGSFADGLSGWNLECQEAALAGASALVQSETGAPAMRIQVTQSAGTDDGGVRCNQDGLKLETGRPYTLALRARAEKPCTIRVGVQKAQAPSDSLGFTTPVELTAEWKPFRWTFAPVHGDDDARLSFTDLGRQADTYWFADVSLKPGGTAGLGKEDLLENASVPVFTKAHLAERTEQAQTDWMQFLLETDRDYWVTMRDFLKHDVGCQALLIGTQLATGLWSTPNIMAQLDVVDSHGYWQHPQFPATKWDPLNWFVENRSMVNEAGGVPADLALYRVQGKPYTCTEYNHPAPNTYSSEGPLLLAAIAGFQDWDGIFFFTYGARVEDLDTRYFTSYFDIYQHPGKMANLPGAAALFLRRDLAPAKAELLASLNAADEPGWLLRAARHWEEFSADCLDMPPSYPALEHRVGFDLSAPPQKDVAPAPPAARPDRFVSDTGEMTWDLSAPGKGIVLLNTKRTRAVIGFSDGRDFRLGDVGVSLGTTRQGWSTLTLTLMEGDSFAGPCRILVTATGDVENTDMGWKSPKKESVGRDWGKAPSVVEIIPAAITLPAPTDKVTVRALDEHGQRAAEVPVEARDGQTFFHIGPPAATLWYEVTIR